MILLGCCNLAYAQPTRETRPDASNRPGGGLDSLVTDQESTAPDTSIFNYNRLITPYQIEARVDTSLDAFQVFDPIYTKEGFLTNLGNLGSATRDLMIRENQNFGFHMGHDQYDPYRLALADFKFYNLNRPYGNFLFSPVNGQENFIVKAEFSRDFANDINVSVDFQRIGQNGFYQNQVAESTYFGVGLIQKKKNRTTRFVGVFNANDDAQNGGVTTDTFSNNSFFDQRSRIAVLLDDAETRTTDLKLDLFNEWRIGESDFHISHELTYSDEEYKFFDEYGTSQLADADSLYLPYTDDNNGIRYYDRLRYIQNQVALKHESSALRMTSGINYRYNWLNLDVVNSQFSDGNWFFDGKLKLINGINVFGSGQYGFARSANDYRLNTGINFSPKLGVKLRAELELSANQTAAFAQALYINTALIFENNFEQIKKQQLSGILDITKTKSQIRLDIININDAIYYDPLLAPTQSNDAIQVTQLSINQGIKWGIFSAENKLIWQLHNGSESVYRVPELMGFADWGIQFYVFGKRLHTKVGVETRFISAYDGPSYNPVLGIYYNADDGEQRKEILLNNLYMSFKIKRFRCFVRFENANNIFDRQVQYYTDGYPIFDFQTRFGVAWLLQD